jgi:hypothetical protein
MSKVYEIINFFHFVIIKPVIRVYLFLSLVIKTREVYFIFRFHADLASLLVQICLSPI